MQNDNVVITSHPFKMFPSMQAENRADAEKGLLV